MLLIIAVHFLPWQVKNPTLLFAPAGEGAGQGHHLRSKGHQEEARRGQQAGGAHPLGEEDPGGGSLAFRRQVSPPARPPKPFPFFILHDEALLH